jgi:hypothetical protein
MNWTSVKHKLPPYGTIDGRTGHERSRWLLVATEKEVLVDPHYMRISDKMWFARGASFATHDIAYWCYYPTHPSEQ